MFGCVWAGESAGCGGGEAQPFFLVRMRNMGVWCIQGGVYIYTSPYQSPRSVGMAQLTGRGACFHAMCVWRRLQGGVAGYIY